MAERLQGRKNILSQIFGPVTEHLIEGKEYERGQKRKAEEEEAAFHRQQQFEEERIQTMKDRVDQYRQWREGRDDLTMADDLAFYTMIFGKDVAAMREKGMELDIKKGEAPKPALTLNERLNQIKSNFKNKREQKLLPYSKKVGDTIIYDFEKAAKDKKDVLKDLEQLEKAENQALREAYQKQGEIPDAGVMEAAMQNVVIELEDDSQVPYADFKRVNEYLNANKRELKKEYKEGDVFALGGMKVRYKKGNFEVIGMVDEQLQ